jgi:hypothetical protein
MVGYIIYAYYRYLHFTGTVGTYLPNYTECHNLDAASCDNLKPYIKVLWFDLFVDYFNSQTCVWFVLDMTRYKCVCRIR